MRLDKLLCFLRLARTRTLAQALVGEGRFRIDGRVIDRAHAEVQAGQVLTFALGGRVRVLRIEALPMRRGPAAEAQACYTDLSPIPDRPASSG